MKFVYNCVYYINRIKDKECMKKRNKFKINYIIIKVMKGADICGNNLKRPVKRC